MTTNAHEINLEMHKLIARELELNGVKLDKHKWLMSKNILQESVMAIIPEIHEGKIHAFGVLFAENLDELENMELLHVPIENIQTARKMVDGKEWFIFYVKNYFYGLVRFKFPLYSEIDLIKNFPLTAGMIIQRNETGITKFYQGDGIIIHDHRRWFSKPNIKEATWKISKCFSTIDKRILSRILEFAFHLLGPITGEGGIIVWFLSDKKISNHLSSLNLSIVNESHSRLLCNLISQVDGATFLDSHGNLMDTGVHLKYSDKSKEIISELKGTRHTSSIRYSYDHEDVIVITISEDGPVTVFSNGSNIADLQIYSAIKKARILKNINPDKTSKVSSSSFEVICNVCDKTSMIEQVNIEGQDEYKKINCTVCKNPLYFASCSSLEGRPYKIVKVD